MYLEGNSSLSLPATLLVALWVSEQRSQLSWTSDLQNYELINGYCLGHHIWSDLLCRIENWYRAYVIDADSYKGLSLCKTPCVVPLTSSWSLTHLSTLSGSPGFQLNWPFPSCWRTSFLFHLGVKCVLSLFLESSPTNLFPPPRRLLFILHNGIKTLLPQERDFSDNSD